MVLYSPSTLQRNCHLTTELNLPNADWPDHLSYTAYRQTLGIRSLGASSAGLGLFDLICILLAR